MIYTVTFNPALDYVLEVDNLNAKDINRSKKEEIYFGGKGINVSAVLSRLGVENKALGFLAGFSGKQLEEMLNEENIKNDFVYLNRGYTRINVKLKSDREMDINAQGPDIKQEDIAALFEKLSVLQEGDFLVLAGSIPGSLPDDIYEKILEQFNGKGINFVVDATGDLLVNVLNYRPFMIKPNHHELGDIFGVEINNTDDIKKYAKKLQDKGAKNILVSCGKNGAVLIDENGVFYTIGNVPGDIISSVGCGDSMVAGFLAGYIETKDYAYALKLGSACGNATAFSPKLAAKAEIDNMLAKQELNKIRRDKNENC
ncbi:MAG: 1-phosphofructokinase [Clostridium sp.]|nr:1-phosphofructokinase [Clostridium sp.]